jgi:hypothetical protein
MSSVRLLVGTRKGAFILTSDAARKEWKISQPHFPGWELYHLKGSPADPNRLYASQSSSWFGQIVQRSDDGGLTWNPVSNKFNYDGVPGTHQWYDGTPHPWEFKRVWHIEPSLTDPDTVFAGAEDAALFKSTDGGNSWLELSGLRTNRTGPGWQPGAGGLCLHTILLDPTDPNRIIVAISAAGAFRSDDAGQSWKPINKGLWSKYIPDPTAEIGHCVHHIAMNPAAPGRSSCRSTGTSCGPTTPAISGPRSVAIFPPTSASPSTFTPTSPKPSTSFRSSQTPNTFRSTVSSRSTAARSVAMNGSHSPRVFRNRTAM